MNLIKTDIEIDIPFEIEKANVSEADRQASFLKEISSPFSK